MNELIQPNFSISKTEMFDITMAKYIVSQPIDNEDKKKLKKMIKNKEKGCYLNIHYILGKKSKQNKYGKEYMGRIVPQGNYGLQTLYADIRNALAMPFYWDVDIVNCQGEILNQLAFKNGWTNTYLNELCINRDNIFKNIMDTTGIDRKQVKVIFLSLFFGGECYTTNEWIKDKFYPEIKILMNNLCNQYPDLLKDCKKSKPTNPIGSACSLILQNEERKLLLKLDEFFTLNGRSMDTLIHDGGYVRKLKDETELPVTLLLKAEEYIYSETKYKIKLIVKPMITTFELPNQVEPDKTYISIKTEFEKRFFLCVSEACFYDIHNRKINKFSKTDLMTAYQGKKYSENIDGLIQELSFIKKWLDDENKRQYEYVDTIIPPFECPDDTYNLWDGLEVENFDNDEKEYTDDILFIKNHIRLLCGGQENLYEFVLKWVACLFQKPAYKNNICIIFKSTQQGMGKNMFFELLIKMIGSKYACVIDKPERDCFGSFNGLMEDKILCLFDEFSGKVGFKYDDDIKSLITGLTIDITNKGVKTKKKNNYTKFIMNTNNDYPVKISANDRRFCICDSSHMDIPPKEYFENLFRITNDKNVLRLFYDELMDIDLTTIDWIKDRPITEAFNDIRMASLDVEMRFILDFIDEKTGITKYKAKEIYDEFINFTIRDGLEFRTSNIKFGIKLKNYKIDGLSTVKCKDCNYYSFDVDKIRKWCISKGYLEAETERLLLT